MSRKSFAETLASEVAYLREMYNRQGNGYAEKKAKHSVIQAGLFKTAGDARVYVGVELTYDMGIRPTVAALCDGFGCADPRFERPSGSLRSDADVAEYVKGDLAEVRKWAQAHAETCRAMPEGAAS